MTNLKIYILPVEKKFMPEMSDNIYPFRNKTAYGVEQDFFIYLNNHPELCVYNPQEADWHYLPVFWFNFYRNYSDPLPAIPEVQSQVDKVIIDSKKTFTICQYNPGILVDAGQTVLFLSSRKSDGGIDIPLLCDRHQVPISCEKKFLASFVGLLWTHEIRAKLKNYFQKDESIKIIGTKKNVQLFVQLFIDAMIKSYIALCPRGTGGDSFRFYEAMDFSVVPFFIGDIDCRPFKKYIDWNSISFFANTVEGVNEILDKYANSLEELLEIGSKAKQVFENEIYYQKWCKYVLKELEDVSDIID